MIGFFFLGYCLFGEFDGVMWVYCYGVCFFIFLLIYYIDEIFCV